MIARSNAVDATLEERQTRLGAIDMFRGVAPAYITELVRHCRARLLADGERLPREPDGTRFFVFVWSGELLVVRDEPTRIIYVNVPEGGLFRLAYAIADADENYDLDARSPSSVLLIPGARVREMARTYPQIGHAVVRTMAERVSLACDGLCRLRVRDPEERVLSAMRVIERQRGFDHGGTVTMLAEHVGLRRETVSRALQALEKRGLVKRDGTAVVWVAGEGAETEESSDCAARLTE